MITKKIKGVSEFLIFFCLGCLTAAFLIGSLFLWFFNLEYRNKIYPGIKVDGYDLSGLTVPQASDFMDKNLSIKTRWEYHYQDLVWLEDIKTLGITIAKDRISQRAFAVGRNSNPYYSFLQQIAAYIGQINLPLEIDWDPGAKSRFLTKIRDQIDFPPIEAQFRFSPNIGPDGRGRVIAFVQSKDGVALYEDRLEKETIASALSSTQKKSRRVTTITIATKLLQPTLTSQKANDLGIVEKLGTGESYFYDSIPNRIYNINLGTEKVSGSLVAPGETFSFSQAIGTVSAVFGFQKAYAIKEGKTVLDDGGGVCQVSTTLFRSVLNAGLPIIERVGHSYRVGFYEQGGFLPGMDATVYPPSPDFKFKNDTGNWLLIQGFFDKTNSKLTFDLYGKLDGRKVELSKPIFISTSPAPEPIYENDPNRPLGQLIQVDTAHAGAKVYFTRKVIRDDQVLIDEKIYTDYIPWPARFLRGTKT